MNSGIPIRDAYKKVALEIENGKYKSSSEKELHLGTHEGSIGNLCNKEIKKQMAKVMSSFPFKTVNLALVKLLKR